MEKNTKIQIEIEKYKKYRTLLPLSDNEIQMYIIKEETENTLSKDYKKILFGEWKEEKEWKDKITKIIISDTIPEDSVIKASDTTICADISEAENGSIIGWMEEVRTGESCTARKEYILHIDSNGKIYAPVDSEELFCEYSQAESIEFRDGFDTSHVTSMKAMFDSCESLKELDIKSFHTQNVTDMSLMFANCEKLESLDLSGFNTQNVTDMSSMFYQCMALKTLDLSGFDMHKVRSMFGMFAHCENLEKLKLGRTGWRAYWGRFWIQTADLSYMFWYCESLKELDLSRFHTGKAGKMEGMFGKCSSLQELDLKRFNTKGVTDMSCMFCGCESLRKIEMSETFDTQSVTNMEEMFKDCKMLKNLDVSHFDTQNVTDMTSMFENCQSIKILDISHFNMQNVTNAEKMFSGCENLDRLPLARKLFEEKEYAAAIETLEEGNDSENAEAQYLLGVCYQNIAEYLQVYGKEFKPVQDFLRICHPNRLDDETLAEMVLKHFEAAAVRGYAPAQVQLGDFCYEGKGTEQDYEKAYEWYQKAAAQGADVDQERLKIAERKSRKGVLDMLKGWLKRS